MPRNAAITTITTCTTSNDEWRPGGLTRLHFGQRHERHCHPSTGVYCPQSQRTWVSRHCLQLNRATSGAVSVPALQRVQYTYREPPPHVDVWSCAQLGQRQVVLRSRTG